VLDVSYFFYNTNLEYNIETQKSNEFGNNLFSIVLEPSRI